MEPVFEFIMSFREAAPYVLFTVLVLVGAVREWWVWGSVFKREREEKIYWRDKALDALGLAEQSLDVAATEIVEKAT